MIRANISDRGKNTEYELLFMLYEMSLENKPNPTYIKLNYF
jgi:hypothetical protein